MKCHNEFNSHTYWDWMLMSITYSNMIMSLQCALVDLIFIYRSWSLDFRTAYWWSCTYSSWMSTSSAKFEGKTRSSRNMIIWLFVCSLTVYILTEARKLLTRSLTVYIHTQTHNKVHLGAIAHLQYHFLRLEIV